MRIALSLSDEEAEALRVMLFGWSPTPEQDLLLNEISDRIGLPVDPSTGQPVLVDAHGNELTDDRWP